MLWQMEHGEHEKTIVEQCRINKMPLPDFLKDKPEIKFGLEFYWKAFWELSTCRAIGMGEGPIPWGAMNDYAERHGIYGDEFDRFVLIIKGMDAAYLEHRHKMQKRNLPKKGKKNLGPPPKGNFRSK